VQISASEWHVLLAQNLTTQDALRHNIRALRLLNDKLLSGAPLPILIGQVKTISVDVDTNILAYNRTREVRKIISFQN